MVEYRVASMARFLASLDFLSLFAERRMALIARGGYPIHNLSETISLQ